MLAILIVAFFLANGTIAPRQTITESEISMSFAELSARFNYRPQDHQNKPSNIPIVLRNTQISTLHFDGITKMSTIGDLKKRMFESSYLLQGDTFKALVKKGAKTEYVSYDDAEVLGRILDKFTTWPPTFFANIFVFVLHLSRSKVIELERFREDSRVSRLRSRLKKSRDIQDGDMLSTSTASNFMIPLYDDDEIDKVPFKESPPQFYINMYTVIIHGYSASAKRRPKNVDLQGTNKYHKVRDLKTKLIALRLVKETDVLATFVQGQDGVKILRDTDTVFDLKFKNLPPDIYLYDNSKEKKKESSIQIQPVHQKTRSEVPTRTPRCYYCKDKRCYYDEGKDPFMERVHVINGELRYGSEIASFAIKYSACQACELQNGESKGYTKRSLPYYRDRMSNFKCYDSTNFIAYAEKYDPKPKVKKLPVAPPPTPQSTPGELVPEVHPVYTLILHTIDGHKKRISIDGLASDDNVGLLKVQLRNLGLFNEGNILTGMLVISGNHTEEVFDNSAILSDIYFNGTPEFKVSKSHDKGVDLVSSQPNPTEVRASRDFTASNEITVQDEMIGIYSPATKGAESDSKHTSNSVRSSTRFQAKPHSAVPGTPVYKIFVYEKKDEEPHEINVTGVDESGNMGMLRENLKVQYPELLMPGDRLKAMVNFRSLRSPQSAAQPSGSNPNDVSDTIGARLAQSSRARSSSVGQKDAHQSIKRPGTPGAQDEDHILRDGGLTISTAKDDEKTLRRGTQHSASSPVVASPTENKHKRTNDVVDSVLNEGGLTISSSPAKSTHRTSKDPNILADVGLTIGIGTPERTVRPSNVEPAPVAAVDVSRLEFPSYGWVTLIKVLGEGSFGKVWSAESDTLPDREMAVKIIRIDKKDKDFEYDTERARSEIQIHSRFGLIPHGSDKSIDINIIGYYDSIMDETSDKKYSFYYILMEKGESTFYGFVNALRKYGRLLNTREIQYYAIEMIKPLAKLHAKQIIHRDLKETNIFYGVDGRLKMGDFGAGREIDDDDGAHTMIGTPKFMAPRVATKDPEYKNLFPEEYEDGYTYDADLWAFAVIVFRLFYNKKYPFADDKAAREGKLQFGKLPKTGEELNKDIQDLLTTLLTPNLVKDSTFETVLNNPWIAEGMKYWEGKKPPFWIEEKEVDYLNDKYYTNGDENYIMT